MTVVATNSSACKLQIVRHITANSKQQEAGKGKDNNNYRRKQNQKNVKSLRVSQYAAPTEIQHGSLQIYDIIIYIYLR